MALFLSNYTFRIDRKGRVSVPADFRSALASQSAASIIAFPSLTDPAIRCSGIDLMEQISANRDPMAVFQSTPTDFALAQAAEATPLSFDGEGRIVLPKHLAAHANITDQATFVGRLNYFEIWAPAAFEAQQERMRQQARATNVGLLPRPSR